MRRVIWQDEMGYMRASILRDDDPDDMARAGIPVETINLDDLDWDWLKRELHNTLVQSGLFTWDDVQRKQNGVTSAIQRVFKRSVVNLYRRR